MQSPLILDRIEVAGSCREMGRAHGESLRERIRELADHRRVVLEEYVRERGRDSADGLLPAARACLARLEEWDPEGWSEHVGVAEGAGMDAVELYGIANVTDLRDVLVIGSEHVEGEGCSALLLPPSRTKEGEILAAQTWDLGVSDLGSVVGVHRRPTDGPETWSVTCVGCPSLMGMNEHGLSLGTTNVRVRGARPGVGYLSVIHRALRERSRSAAASVVVGAPRAAAHTYWLADAKGALELECSVERVVRRDLEDTPLTRTNHCLDARHVAREGEEPTSSSLRRRARLESLASNGLHDVASVRRILADRSDGIDSISRHVEDGQISATNACFLCAPARRLVWACRGPSERGEWVVLPFD